MPCDKMCLIKAFIYQTIYISRMKRSPGRPWNSFFSREKGPVSGMPLSVQLAPTPATPSLAKREGVGLSGYSYYLLHIKQSGWSYITSSAS